MLAGAMEPRLFTPPAGAGSLGPECREFAEQVLGIELFPAQVWLLDHLLELHPDGDRLFRFRTALVLMARQNSKTTLSKIIILWAMFTGRVRLVLGIAQSVAMARETWRACLDMIEELPHLRAELAYVRNVNGEQEFRLANGARYKIAANNRKAGRGLSVDLLVMDELREHRDWEGYGALAATTAARPDALTLGLSNAGDDASVVLNSLRATALAGADPALGIFEWSAPDGCALDDPAAWAAANPGLGYTITEAAIRSAMSTNPPAVARTEILCQRVEAMDNALDASAWRDGRDAAEIPREARLAACFDVSPDGAHASLVVAQRLSDGRVRVAVAGAWTDTRTARNELGPLLDKLAPASLGWFPAGPAAAFGPVMTERAGVVSLTGGLTAQACMGLSDLVASRLVLHNGDPLLDAQVAGCSRLHSGDGWRFTRRGVGHADAAYACAGAVLLAQQLPPDIQPWASLVIRGGQRA